jgi:tetratricopeptide (TPR) repeat protein
MAAEYAYDLFISYQSGDVERAQALHDRLAQAGFRVWLDRARLKPGCNWHREIEAGCEASRILLPVLTPRWRTSEWTRYETYGAEVILPLLYEGEFEEVAPLPLREHQFKDMRAPTEATWESLYASLREHLARPAPEKAGRFHFLPYAHNPYFVGREALLLEIHEKLFRAPTAALTQGAAFAVAGLGGVGKTTVAREYAEKFWRLYRDILWVRAGRDTLLSDFARMALELGLIAEPSREMEEDARRALRELCGGRRRLLILDNVEDEESIQEWIPASGGCHTLLTSRFTGWSAAIQTVPVYVLEPEPARELLLRRSGLPDREENRAQADRLAETLGYLPLALEQAAALVNKRKYSFQNYQERLQKAESRRDLLAQRVLGGTQYPRSVATTWLTTMEHLSKEAAAVLSFLAFLAPDDIPRDLLMGAADFIAEEGLSTFDFRLSTSLESALDESSDYSMVKLQEQALSVHRLVQAVLRDGMDRETQRLWAERAVRAVSRAFPDPEFPNWPLCERLLPHAQACAEWIERFEMALEEAARLLNQAGYYLHLRARYTEAEPLFRRALAIREQVLGSDHPDTAQSLSNLAAKYKAQGCYGEAEPLYWRALAITESALGENHPSTAVSLNNLAALYDAQGRYGEAEPLFWRALAIFESALGEEHPDTAGSLNNLASLYRAQGRYGEAELLCRRALAIREQVLGSDHPATAVSLNLLALLSRTLGRYEEAETLYRRALAIQEHALGPEHPDTAQSLNNLAFLYCSQDRYEEAELLCRKALAITESALGENHPSTAVSLNNLAFLYASQGRYAEAGETLLRVLSIFVTALGEEHPDTATVMMNLAAVLRASGKEQEAREMEARAEAARQAHARRNRPPPE